MHATARHSLTNSHPAPRSATAPFAGLTAWIERAYTRWQDRVAERHALETMSERDLRDAGLTRAATHDELARAIDWRA